jgi:dual specificity tyrosine-phosphorylation-regulated kinase 2/3/4
MTLNASSKNNHSLFAFGGHQTSDDNTTSSYDFLPSPSFDDLQSSINGSSHDISGHSLDATGNRSKIREKRSREAMDTTLVEGRGPTIVSRAPSGARPIRSGSILRRQSTSTRQSSVSSTTSAVSGLMDPPAAPPAARTRRQSQYPPISGSGAANNVISKAPRKSIGPGVNDSDLSKSTQRRRPSLASSQSQGLSDAAVSTRPNIGATNTYTDGARGLTASRAAKTKSLQPPSRQGQTQGHLAVTVGTPDHSRSLSFAGRSPGRANGRGTNTPSSSAKRMSIMPGMPQSSHATGLGARTVSPTDARRAKRLSVLQHPPPIPNTPPAPQQDVSTVRRASRSPSMLPRMVRTPSSSRTTPDINNRKSYSSGLSVGSSASYNTVRTSTGSLQPRGPQPPSTSRLPTPKPRNVHSSAGNNDEEEVPPVPAIPKAYESPKESPGEPPYFNNRKSSMPFDASSINSTSTNSLSGRASTRDREPIKTDRTQRQYNPLNSSSDLDQQKQAAPSKTKNLQPLRLPPLNLLPLSTPTTDKIAALREPSTPDGQGTTSARRANAKTPSTPMTASKSSFFSRNRHDDKPGGHDDRHMRSSSSINQLRLDSSSRLGGSSSESTQPIPIKGNLTRQAVSPYISSSLPKSSEEHSYMPRSKTTGALNRLEDQIYPRPAGHIEESEQTHTRPTGPRAQKTTRLTKTDTPTRISSPEEPTTPSSTTSSLRRKLSLSWKRSTSKSNINAAVSHAANERGLEYAPLLPKHDNMPPPKLPASAAPGNNSVPSPSPSLKSTTYLDSKRRKSSVSSLSIFSSHDRARSESWGVNGSPKKEQPSSEARNEKGLQTRTSTSAMSKMLNPKASSTALRSSDPWTVDLNKSDLLAEDEIKKLGSKRKETEIAAKLLDSLRKRAISKEHISPQQAAQMYALNIYERGEIVDYKDVYFTGNPGAAKHVGELSAEALNFGYDDERGDYTIAIGDHLAYRYEVVDVLGKGSFGQVVRCIDYKTGGLVAIKIIRNKKRFHQQALVEVNILQKLREWVCPLSLFFVYTTDFPQDPQNKYSMVSFTQSFYFRGHLCISTELLDMNLYEFIKSNSFRGFSLNIVRRFTKQMLSSLLLLKKHRVIHCDLKPENILLAHPLHSEIKVIDFGSSCFENQKVYTYIQSRFYRSPEVILGMTYGLPIDMWSLGCIMAELYTGVPIFPGENEQEQLACIMEVFGPPEKHLIEKSTRRKLFFDSLGKPRLTVSSKGRRRRPSSKTLQQALKCEDEAFLDFLTRCLRWDPERRLKPDEAVRHEFLTGQKSTTGSTVGQSTTVRRPTETPLKRNNTITTPSATNRPLPDPPATSFKNGTAVSRTREASPTKSLPPTVRRVSNIGNGTITTTGSRRISTGPTLASGGSNLPRIATRSTSGRQDLASAGATVAMNKRT